MFKLFSSLNNDNLDGKIGNVLNNLYMKKSARVKVKKKYLAPYNNSAYRQL